MKIKNVWNHHLDIGWYGPSTNLPFGICAICFDLKRNQSVDSETSKRFLSWNKIYKPPWQIFPAGSPTAITQKKKGKWSEPNLQGIMFRVNLQGCTAKLDQLKQTNLLWQNLKPKPNAGPLRDWSTSRAEISVVQFVLKVNGFRCWTQRNFYKCCLVDSVTAAVDQQASELLSSRSNWFAYFIWSHVDRYILSKKLALQKLPQWQWQW